MVTISVIIPVYNAEKYIDQCIKSCLAQTYQNFEVIAVNDGSKDMSGVILDSYAQMDKRIKVIHSENHGVTKARRTAIKHSTGEWLFFLDADDMIPKYALAHLLDKATKEMADLVIGNFFYCQPNGNIIRLQQNDIGNDALLAALRFKSTGNLCGRLILHTLLEKLEWPSDEIQIGEDLCCGLQLLALSNKTIVLSESVYYYIQYPLSTINSRNPKKVASMIPYLEWVDQFFDLPGKKALRKDADYFLLNEYFAFLRYGGTYDAMKKIKIIFLRCDKSQLPIKLKIAYSPFGKLALKLAKFFW